MMRKNVETQLSREIINPIRNVTIIGAGAIGQMFNTELLSSQKQLNVNLVSHTDCSAELLTKSDIIILATPNHSVQPLVSQVLELGVAEVKLPTLLLIQNGVGVANQVRRAILESENPNATLSVVRGSVFTQVSKTTDELRYDRRKLRIAFAPISADQEELCKVEALFRDAQFETKVFLDADSLEWTKLLFNTLGSTSVITGLTPQETFSDQALFKLEADAFFERSELLRKSGIEVAQIDWVKTQLLPLLKHAGKFSKVQPLRSVMAQTIGKQRNNQPSAAWKKVLERGNLDEAIHYHQAFVDLAIKNGMRSPVLDRVIVLLLDEITQGTLFVSDLNETSRKNLISIKIESVRNSL